MSCIYKYKGKDYTKDEFYSLVRTTMVQPRTVQKYNKILFPTGNTASRIEGHSTLEEFKKQKENRIKELEEKKKTASNNKPWLVSKITDNKKYYFNTEEEANEFRKTNGRENFYSATPTSSLKDSLKNVEDINTEITQLKQELERVETEGFGSLKPIFNFYENTVTNILKKQGYNPTLITDEYGNTWNEVTLNSNLSTKPILLQRKDPLIIPTRKRSNLEGKSNILKDHFKKVGVTVDVQFDNEQTENADVRYDSPNKATIRLRSEVFNDTLEHEFAHIYVDLAGVNSEIMTKFWNQIQESERNTLNQISELYPDLDEGSEAYKREVMATIIGREASKITPKKLSKIQIILNQIYRFIAAKFGKEPNWGRQLATQMMQGEFTQNQESLTEGLKQQQRTKSNEPVTPQEFNKNLLTELKDKLIRLGKKVSESRSGQGVLKIYKNVFERMEEANDIVRFQILNDFITEQLNLINARLTSRNNIDDSFLYESIEFIKLYSDIDNIVDQTGTDFEDVIDKLSYTSVQINALRKRLLEEIKLHVTNKFGKISTNPKFKDDLSKILDSEKDINTLTRWLTPLYESTELFQLVDKYFKQEMDKAFFMSEKYKEEFDGIFKLLKAKGFENFDWLHELDGDTTGKKTARYINEYKYTFYQKVVEYNDIIAAYEDSDDPAHKLIVEKTKEDKKKFLTENSHQPYSKEYYDIFKILDRIPEARERRDQINKSINKLLRKTAKSETEFDPQFLSADDFDQLIRLQEEKNELASLVDLETGLPKVGIERDIALLIREFNKTISTIYENNMPKEKLEAFKRAKEIAKGKGEEYYQKWLQINTIVKIDDKWYERLEEAFSLLENTEKSEISLINKEIDELVSDYKAKGGYIRANLLYQRNPELFNKILELERKKEAILIEKAKNSSKYLRPYEIPPLLNIAGTKKYFDKLEEFKSLLSEPAKRWKKEYKDTVNAILIKYVKEGNTFNSYEITHEDLIALLEAKNAYRLKTGGGKDYQDLNYDQQTVRNYANMLGSISEFVDNKELKEQFESDKAQAAIKGSNYLEDWIEWFGGKKDIFFDITGDIEVLSTSGYTVLIPLPAYIDKKKTKAYRILNELLSRVNSPDYERAKAEAESKGVEAYTKWYNDNHTYDPITQKHQPLRIWTKSTPKSENFIDTESPSYHWQESTVKSEYINPEFEANKDPKTGYGNPLGEHKSEAYKKLMSLPADDPRRIFYSWYTTMMNDMTKDIARSILDVSYYPVKYTGKTKTIREKIKDIPKELYLTHKSELETYQAAAGLKLRLPFTQSLTQTYIKKDDTPEEKLKKIKANREYHKNNITYDVSTMLDTFIPGMLKYKAKNNMEDEIFLVEETFLTYSKMGTQSGIKKLLSNKLRAALGPGTEKEETVLVQNESSEIYARFKDWLNMVFYEEGLVPLHGSPNAEGYAIDYNKIFQSLQKYTQYKALALNVYAGVSNVTLGQMQLKTEAVGSLFFNSKNLREGSRQYYKDLPFLLNDVFNVEKKSLSGKIMKIFSWETGEAGSDSLVDRYGKLDKYGTVTNSLMFIQRSGDFMLQAKLVFSMLSSHTVKDGKIVRITDPKTEKSILSTYKELEKTHPELKPSDLITKLNITIEEYSNFKQKIKFVFDRLNGIYNLEDKAAFQKLAIGSMAMMFRKWIVPGFQRRWGKKTFYEVAQTTTQGHYWATWEFFMKIKGDLAKLNTGLIMNEWSTLPDYQKAGIRATLMEVGYLMLMMLALMLFLNHDDDDDEPESYINAFARFQAQRLRADLMFFTPVSPITGDLWKIIRTPLVTMSTVEDITNFFYYLGAYPFQNEEERIYQAGSNKDKYKLSKNTQDLIPIIAQINRLKNPSEIANFYRIFK